MQSDANKDAYLSKITPPKISNIVRRERLFKILNKERNSPILWITAPAGSGKTTLIAGYLAARKIGCLWYQIDEGDSDISTFFYYMGLAAKKANPYKRKPLPLLTQEYLQGIPVFARRYFEELYSRLTPLFSPPLVPMLRVGTRYHAERGNERGKGGVIVFDNYQDVPNNSTLHEIIATGMDIIPHGIQTVFVSRHQPPAAFARLRANNRISFLGWNEIRLTIKETEKFIKAKSPKLKARSYNEIGRYLQEKTDGWAAGLILMAGAMAEYGAPVAGHRVGRDFRLTTLDTSAIFNYFARELFEKTENEIQNFLLKTSFLPSMTASMAEMLTGNSNAKNILSWLSRNHYFTNSPPLKMI